MKSNEDIINEQHEGLVQNWGDSAQLLSFKQVMDLMSLARKEASKPLKDYATLIGTIRGRKKGLKNFLKGAKESDEELSVVKKARAQLNEYTELVELIDGFEN